MNDQTDDRSKLKQTIRKIVMGQGNRFIRELLRDNGMKIGTTKADFLANVMDGVDAGSITADMIGTWLTEIEGWGNQHVYLFEPLTVSPDQIVSRIEASEYAGLLNREATHDFPDELSLTSIRFEDNTLSFVWHRGNDRWRHIPTKDYTKEEDGDLYEYRAYLRRSYRTVIRFEWQIGKPYCAVLLQLPHEGSVHTDVIAKVWEIVQDIPLQEAPPARLALSDSVNTLSTNPAVAKASGRTMRVQGGRVDLISDVREVGIADIEALRALNGAVDPLLFVSADGRFYVPDEVHDILSRPISIDIYGSQGRLRIGVQCKREDVYYLTDLVLETNNP